MIEFAYLIHKETETVISYSQWLEFLEKEYIGFNFQKPIIYSGNGLDRIETKHYEYKPKDMIFNEAFKIIYKHDLVFNELREIHNALMMQSVYENPLIKFIKMKSDMI